MSKTLSLVAGILFVLGYIPYIRAIWQTRKLPTGAKGKAEPAKASWVIWTTLDAINLAAMYAANTLNGQIVGAIVGAMIVVVLALRFGKPGWTKLDRLCLGGAAAGIALWAIFQSPVLGIAVSNAVVFIGSFPTFASAWKDPSRENRLAWTLYWVSCLFATAAIPAWTLGDATQPLTFLAVETIMMFILFVRPRFRSVEPATLEDVV